MESPNYVLTAKEVLEITKNKQNTTTNSIGWKIILIFTLIFVAFDLLAYQRINSFGAYIGLNVLYIRLTFPVIKNRKRIIIWFILSLVILFDLIVEEHVLLLMIAIPLYLWAAPSKEREKVFVPVEIQFYNDYLVIYREKNMLFGLRNI